MLLKRGISGTYVSVEPFHLHRYLDEQMFRFNNRKDLKDAGRFDLAVRQIGKAEDSGLRSRPLFLCSFSFSSPCLLAFLQLFFRDGKNCSHYGVKLLGLICSRITTGFLHDFRPLSSSWHQFRCQPEPHTIFRRSLLGIAHSRVLFPPVRAVRCFLRLSEEVQCNKRTCDRQPR